MRFKNEHISLIIKQIHLAALLLVISAHFTLGQSRSIGFQLPEKVDWVEFKFEKISNLIVVPVKVNNSATIKFILDTGAESAILTESVFAEILGLNFVREISIFSPGVVDSVKAFVATDVTISIESATAGNGLSILVLEEDYLELHKNLGEEVYGILGYDIFSRFVVGINYDTETITLHKPEKYRAKKSFQSVDITIDNTKPYINASFSQGDQSDTVRLMVDTGASHAVLIDLEATDHLVLPDKLVATRLGRGLGGEIKGYIGRLDKCTIGDFEFEQMLAAIPEQGAYSSAIKRGSRHGTIGGELLSRFNVVFDYSQEKMYFHKGKIFDTPFEYNMSGITLLAEGENLDYLYVIEVNENSPAFDAGMRVGDIVLKINGLNLRNSNVSDINTLLRKKPGFKIRALVYRNGKKSTFKFRLKRLI